MKRIWKAILEFLNAPAAEIEGCRTCKWAVWHGEDGGREGLGFCRHTGSHVWRMTKCGDIYHGNPYRAEQCGAAYERREAE